MPAISRDAEQSLSKIKRFVEDVVYVVEVGDREPTSKRWLSAPTLTVDSADPSLQKFVEGIFTKICQVARLTDTGDSPLTVHIGHSKELTKIAEGVDRRIQLKSGHSYWAFWNGDGSLKNAFVFLCVDRVRGPIAADALLEDMLGAFGFSSRSREFDETCLSSKPKSLTALTPLDEKLIAFYYNFVPPGTRKAELRKLCDAHWNSAVEGL